MAALESTTLRDIAQAVADELELDSVSRVSVSQVTVTITYEVQRHPDLLDQWYDEWCNQHDEVPF